MFRFQIPSASALKNALKARVPMLAVALFALACMPAQYAAAQDVPGDGSTTVRLDVPGTLTGTIDTTSDQDAFLVALVSGGVYQFDAERTSGDLNTSLGVYPPGHTNFVGSSNQACFDATGVLAGNEDIGGGNSDSQFTYTATQTGDHLLCIDAFGSNQTSGDYRLTAAVTSEPTTPPDLTITAAPMESSGTLSYTVTNAGGPAVVADVAVNVVRATDNTFDTAAMLAAIDDATCTPASGTLPDPCRAVSDGDLSAPVPANDGTNDGTLPQTVSVATPANGQEYFYFVCLTVGGDTDCSPFSAGVTVSASALQFDNPVLPQLAFLIDEVIDITLPEATGVSGALTYTSAITSDGSGMYPGLTFTAGTRVVSGSHNAAATIPLEYGVTDSGGTTLALSPAISLTIEANTMPIFSQGQDIPDMVYIVNEAITPVTLPAVDPGTGNAPIMHFFPTSTSPGLPPGLTFNRMTRVLSGTPDTEGTTNGIIYRAFDRNNDFTDKTTGNNEITFSITVVGPLAGLSVVRDLTVSERRKGSRPRVFLAWQAPAMVPSGVTITGYEIQSCRQNDFSDCTTQTTVTAAPTSVVLRFMTPPRHWRVRALTAGGFSPWAEASLDAFTPSPTVAPGPVRDLASSGITDTGVTLTWLAPDVDADGMACVDFNDSPCGAGYVVRRGFPDGETPPGLILDPAPVEVSIGSLLTYTDAALLPGTAYLYEVYATNSALSGAPVRLAVTTTGTPGTIPTTITGDDTGAVTEGDGTAVVMLSGDLDDSSTAGDDNDFVLDEGTIGLYGTFTIGTDGAWVYTLIPERALALNTDDMVDDVFTVTATAPDAAGLTVTHTVTITVTGVNSPPNGLILVTDTTVEVGGTIVLGGGATDPDDRNTALTVEWTANGGTLINPVGAGIEWVATNGANSYTLTQTVTDPGGLFDTQDVTITVTGASPAAAITNIPLHEEDLDTATMTVVLINTEYEDSLTPGLFTPDPDSSFTGLTVSSVVRDDDTTATLTLAYTGSISSGADTELSVTVTDAAHTGSDDLTARSTLTVNADVAPTFGATTPIALTFVEAVPITPTRLPAATGGNGALTYSIAPSLPLGLALNPVTRFVTGTPTAGQTATTYTYTVTDSDPVTPDRADFTSAFSITIGAVEALTFGGGATIADQTYTIGTTVSVALPTATGGIRPLTYTTTGTLPDGLALTAATGVLAGTPTTEQVATPYTYTVTDAAGDTAQLTFNITIRQPSAGTERALEKTLAAFGRAFATGTVGIFEDYLSGTGTSANTNHFTIGGHRFKLASNAPGQTHPVAVGTSRDLSAPSFPNDRKTGSDSDRLFHRIGNPVEHDLADTINSANLADTTSNGANADTPTDTTTTLMSGHDLLMKSAFHFNLNDAASGASGWSIWARATTGNFDGKPEDDFELDGDVTSAYLGADYHTPTGTRLGIAISQSDGEVDYDDATAEAQGDLDADLTSVLPYIQWTPSDTTNAWAMLGYGEGDAELSTDGEDETTDVDIDMQMTALGISGDLTAWKRSEWSWKASAFSVKLESEADEANELPVVDASAQRLRAAIQGRAPGQISATGAQFTPNWELGLRWDDGDAEQGSGADVGLGFGYTNPASGLNVRGKTTFLVAHEAEDYEEWDASLQVRLDPGVQGRGVTFALEPGWTEDGRSQRMGMDFSNALGKWTKRGLRLELIGGRTEKDDNDIGHTIRMTGSLYF